MAEQEACTALVDEAAASVEKPATPTPAAAAGHIDGESQLLPLLQGLLVAPANDVTPDSGTESGEDQRSGLIAEVQNALEKLSNSLKSDQTDITPERRSSLLQLVCKLQAGLSGGGVSDRRSSTTTSGAGRFQKRRSRQTRHTVGVSKEELADARRLIEEISLNELTPSGLSKQNSESSVPTSSASSSYKNVAQAKVKNATAKPFSSSNSSSSIHTPTELVEAFELLFGEEEDSNTGLKKNPIYTKPSEETSTKAQRFDPQGRRLKMKRANTIDIPKPLFYYEDDEESEEERDSREKRDGYPALKGPLGVSNPSGKKIVPAFEPKTESDKKFLAFINKHNDAATDKSSPWAAGASWGSRFGNLKSNFERNESFWRSSDDDARKPTHFGPKISRRSARNLQEMFAEKQKENSIVTGSLTVRSEPQPVNQFSHAPQSAFKPLPKKTMPEGGQIVKSEIKRDEGSVFLYSPRPLRTSGSTGSPCSSVTSPTVAKPWTATAGGSRVLSLAVAKFEQQPRVEPPKPQKLFGRVAVPSALQEPSRPAQKPYHADVKSSTVRKLSGQYDEYRPQTYQVSANVTQKHYVPTYSRQNSSPSNYVPQNYTIRYDQAQQRPQNRQISAQSPPTWSAQPQQQRIYQHVPGQQPAKPPSQYHNYTAPPIHQHLGQQVAKPPSPSHNYTAPPNHQQLGQQVAKPPSQYHNYTAPSNHQHLGQQVAQPPSQSHNYVATPNHQHLSQHVAQPPSQSHNYTAPPNHQQLSRQVAQLPSQYHNNVAPPNEQQLGQQVAKSPTTQTYSRLAGAEPHGTPDYHSQDAQFTSTLIFKPQKAVEPMMQPKLQTQISNESLHEHTAVSSKVMTGPVSQQATFVKQKSPMSREQHDIEAAFNLKNTLRNVKPEYKSTGQDAKSCGVVRPIIQPQKPLEKLQIDDRGRSVVTGHFHIPLINVKSPESPRAPTHAQILSKSDSWHQICLANQGAKTALKSGATVVRSKSSHTLAVPKMFEAGMSKEEMSEKRKAMESFLGGAKSPPGNNKVVKRSINRVKTAEKVSVSSRGISRSRTLPDMVCPDLLDESKVDESFEELFKTS